MHNARDAYLHILMNHSVLLEIHISFAYDINISCNITILYCIGSEISTTRRVQIMYKGESDNLVHHFNWTYLEHSLILPRYH